MIELCFINDAHTQRCRRNTPILPFAKENARTLRFTQVWVNCSSFTQSNVQILLSACDTNTLEFDYNWLHRNEWIQQQQNFRSVLFFCSGRFSKRFDSRTNHSEWVENYTCIFCKLNIHVEVNLIDWTVLGVLLNWSAMNGQNTALHNVHFNELIFVIFFPRPISIRSES